MASWVLSECGIKPIPQIFPKPRTGFISNSAKNAATFPKNGFLHENNKFSDPKFTLCSVSFNGVSRNRKWVTKVSAPSRIAFLESNEEKKTVYGVNEGKEDIEFDYGSPPPFKLGDIRAAIPKHCWVKDPWRSMSYVARDVAIVFGLALSAIYLNKWFVWPLYWVAQGTMFWALFVLGHDWRISHRTHHQNHGHVENDESWHPWNRSPGKTGSHFDPNSDLFVPNERKNVITSTVCWTAMAALLVGLSFVIGPFELIKLYGVPYWGFVMWLDLVTYLHHHGHEDKLPWYRGKEWNYLRGGLTTLDRDYGWINNIHHDIGTHVIHHLFPQIPHYHLVEATNAAKPVLGKYYRAPKKSGPLPFYLIGDLIRSLKQDHYVSDTGDVVYYQTDPQLGGSVKSKE
ncbi:hypothetical protein DH2020_045946 [Rehmannia glutinosa]|uniref:Omega-3 fatty acid desaturase n=1 Tax=Rehmannia glutinosa TaxID=99300 RepID=A0ABR0UDG7_REHGL